VLLAASIFYITAYQLKATATAAAANGVNASSGATAGTLAGIGQPLSATQLNAINGAPDSYFEAAGEMLLNGSLLDYPPSIYSQAVAKHAQYPAFVAGGKPSVIYLGAISCVYCGENRWAMALALSRFGSFSTLYQGYSALGDGDVPTLYWTTDNYNSIGTPKYGNAYSSSHINFISAEYDSQISQSLAVQDPAYFAAHAPNSTYRAAMLFLNSTGEFGGTPFTFWGTSLNRGADGIVLGDSLPSSQSFQISNWTHAQIFSKLASDSTQFAWSEYAAADIYAAQVCPAISDSNSIAFCALPAVVKLEAAMNLT
jgi:hypothetical protein